MTARNLQQPLRSGGPALREHDGDKACASATLGHWHLAFSSRKLCTLFHELLRRKSTSGTNVLREVSLLTECPRVTGAKTGEKIKGSASAFTHSDIHLFNKY